ncbi:MAK10-like protein [Tanacetum coccineum]
MLIPRLRSGDPNQHLKDFLKLVESLDLDVANKEKTRLCLFQFSLRDQASNWLERLPAGSISTWEDLTTRFLSRFFPSGRTAKLCNDILMFQQNQDVPSTSDHRLIELESQVQCLMEAHLAPNPPVQVNKIASSCEICCGPHDTQYCMENPKQYFVDYASSRNNEEAGIVEPDATKNNDHKIIVEVEEKEKELSGSETVTKEGGSRDIERDDPDNRTCREAKEVQEDGE